MTNVERKGKLGPDGSFIRDAQDAAPLPAFRRELPQRKTYEQLLQDTLAKAPDAKPKRESDASFFELAAQPEADEDPEDTSEEEAEAQLPARAKSVESREEREEKAGVGVLDPSNPLAVAKCFIALRGQHNGTRIIHRWRGKFWNWRDNHYRPTDDDAVRIALYNFLSAGEQEVRLGAVCAYVSLPAKFVSGVSPTRNSG
jgi:hypothetical protein